MYRFNTLLPLIAMIILLSLSSAYAIEPIPEESGFSGYLTLGGGYSHVKSNMIAGNAFGNVGNRTVDSLTDEPGFEQFRFSQRQLRPALHLCQHPHPALYR